jgi:Flp pilus assembly pilin Flp
MKVLFLLLKDEKAATAIEYALIVALVSIVGVIASNMAGQQLVNSFSKVSSTLGSANR